jgi:SAM-dependent methyltransferase
MKESEYPRFFAFETSHWWFRGLHSILIQTLNDIDVAARPLVLDAGCGTGGLMAKLRDNAVGDIIGFDLSEEASHFWAKRNLSTACRASINDIPLPPDSIDVVFCVNVFECNEVDPEVAYAELWRITKPGGYIILSMPAHHWLGSKRHDAAINGSRRSTRKEFRAIMETRPITMKRMTHLFPLFLPLIAAWRFVTGILSLFQNAAPQTDLAHLPKPINEILFRCTQVERCIVKHMDVPFGSSLLAVARKKSATD